MHTTIRVSSDVYHKLEKRRINVKTGKVLSFNGVIERLLDRKKKRR